MVWWRASLCWHAEVDSSTTLCLLLWLLPNLDFSWLLRTVLTGSLCLTLLPCDSSYHPWFKTSLPLREKHRTCSIQNSGVTGHKYTSYANFSSALSSWTSHHENYSNNAYMSWESYSLWLTRMHRKAFCHWLIYCLLNCLGSLIKYKVSVRRIIAN